MASITSISPDEKTSVGTADSRFEDMTLFTAGYYEGYGAQELNFLSNHETLREAVTTLLTTLRKNRVIMIEDDEVDLDDPEDVKNHASDVETFTALTTGTVPIQDLLAGAQAFIEVNNSLAGTGPTVYFIYAGVIGAGTRLLLSSDSPELSS
jgi:hypothetical protein